MAWPADVPVAISNGFNMGCGTLVCATDRGWRRNPCLRRQRRVLQICCNGGSCLPLTLLPNLVEQSLALEKVIQGFLQQRPVIF